MEHTDGTQRGLSVPSPKLGTRLRWHCLTCRTRSGVFVPTRPVCTSFPGAEPALSPAVSQSSLSLFPPGPGLFSGPPSPAHTAHLCLQPGLSLHFSLLCRSPFHLSWVLVSLQQPGVLSVQVAATLPSHPLARRLSQVPGAQTLVLSPAPHWLCDLGRINPVSGLQFLHL